MSQLENITKLRDRATGWLLRNRPSVYLKRKRLEHHRMGDDADFLAILAELIESQESITTFRERYNLWTLVRSVRKLPGAIAEFGVYRGGSAMILAAAKGDTPLHLFDTFDGMPETDSRYDGVFSAGMFKATDLESVKARLSKWKNIEFHKGFFPESASDLDPDLKFKFVNSDVDIYKSTIDCLSFFYPRLVKGGFFVCHDYNSRVVPGAKIAVDEFMRDKPETVLQLWDTQALIVKG